MKTPQPFILSGNCRQLCHWSVVLKAPAAANGVSGLAHSDLHEVGAGIGPGQPIPHESWNTLISIEEGGAP